MEYETKMKRLTAELMDSYKKRALAVSESQANTQNQIRANKVDRDAMAADQRSMLDAFMNQLRVDNASVMADTSQARQQASNDKQRELSDFVAALRSKINLMNADTTAFIEETGTNRAAMSADQHSNLSSARAQLFADIAIMRQGIQAAEAAMRADQSAARIEWLRFRKAKNAQ